MALNVKKTLLKARGLAKKGALEEAARLYTVVLEAYPQNREAAKGLSSLGQKPASARQPGSFAPREQVEQLLRLFNGGQLQGAVEHGQALVRQFPADPLLHNLVGTACIGLKQLERAIPSLREAVRLKPDYAEAFSNLGSALNKLGQHDEAITSFTRAIKYAPGDVDAHYNLGNTLRDAGRPHEAIARLRHATRVAPGHYKSHYNLAGALLYIGDLAGALAAYDRAIEIEPGNTEALSNRLVTLSQVDAVDAAAQLELAKAYGRVVSGRVREQYDHWDCPDEPGVLRIGFVSADFREHPVGYFLEGMLSHIDREAFQVFAYSNSADEDATSERLKSLFDRWQHIAHLDDTSAASFIHADAPHILVDLSGHTRAGRLGVFAHKPAPLQVTWLGYWATTGVEQIDYKLGDRFVTPPGGDEWFSETVWRLPRSVLCFTPPEEDMPVASLPALDNGYITFGCFNTFSKLNTKVIETWADILLAVPSAKLFLKAKALDDDSVAEQVSAQFASHGVARDRLILEGPSSRAEYFEAYHRVDVALDPFPYPGGTTSAEALWMGVPVLSLRGSGSPLSGQGESVLHYSGLPDWVAQDRKEYVAKAAGFAADVPALSQLRESLREQVLDSDFFNARQFAGDFQDAMAVLWERHRSQG